MGHALAVGRRLSKEMCIWRSAFLERYEIMRLGLGAELTTKALVGRLPRLRKDKFFLSRINFEMALEITFALEGIVPA